ncbi:hypothetical protein EVAR_29059_1 [Eumeta japonica]|uniref:Uncharacterized protein n=1 Tax=Eumeta variegata TaxID=151549 RepID=A0A4C1VNU3_EUMVA|nr:hypothetical protein EVAR_29059_1 [Eumeta japonica]
MFVGLSVHPASFIGHFLNKIFKNYKTYFCKVSSLALEPEVRKIHHQRRNINTLQTEIVMVSERPDDMFKEREQFQEQYALVWAARALLDDHAPQHRRGGSMDTESVTGSREVEPARPNKHSFVKLQKIDLKIAISC